MPREKGNSSPDLKFDGPEKSSEPEEHVDLEDAMEEEIEYEEVEEEEVEEVEEEEEIEEEEEVEEEEEEVEEEEEEEEDEEKEEKEEEEEDEEGEEEEEEEVDADAVSPIGDDSRKKPQDNEDGMSSGPKGNEERKKHSDLLALPPHGSEIYIGGIPHHVSEEELRSFCESVGEVFEVRIMKGKNSTENKGYAFVTFLTKELAEEAIESLNHTEFKGKKVKCSTSQPKHRLFIGNIPRTWMERDLEKAVKKMGPGVISVELLKEVQNSNRNRGFAFVEYYNHACAEYSIQKMSNPKFKLENNAPTVRWADPKSADPASSSQVKAVYVKNLPKNVTEDNLRQMFERHGEITKVVLPPAKSGMERSRFGFVHFAERSDALKAIRGSEKYKLDGRSLECSLAKPPAERKPEPGSSTQKAALLPSFQHPFGFGLPPFGALGAGYGAAGFAPHMMYGREQMPGGMAMVPMLFPDANNLDHKYLRLRHSQEGATEAMAGLVEAGKIMITEVADIVHTDASCHLVMMIQIYVGDHLPETKSSFIRFYLILLKFIRFDMLVIFLWVERLL